MTDEATQAQLKYISALLHQKAEQHNRSYQEVRDELKQQHGFTNYAKLTKREISTLINQLQANDGQTADSNSNTVATYVDLYAQIWMTIQDNRVFTGLQPKERSIAAAGIFRELIKDRRTDHIAELQGK